MEWFSSRTAGGARESDAPQRPRCVKEAVVTGDGCWSWGFGRAAEAEVGRTSG